MRDSGHSPIEHVVFWGWWGMDGGFVIALASCEMVGKIGLALKK